MMTATAVDDSMTSVDALHRAELINDLECNVELV